MFANLFIVSLDWADGVVEGRCSWWTQERMEPALEVVRMSEKGLRLRAKVDVRQTQWSLEVVISKRRSSMWGKWYLTANHRPRREGGQAQLLRNKERDTSTFHYEVL
jgi:hypothetical protein